MVETVVLLSKGEIPSKKVKVEFSLEGMDTDGFKDGATYDEIRDCKCLIHIGLQLMLCYDYKAHICFEHW